MTIQELLKEYDLEIDDVRWYLSKVLAQRLLSYQEDQEELVRFIWGGRLNDDLYNMEERYLKDLQDQINEKTLDESHVRDILNEMESFRRQRRGY